MPKATRRVLLGAVIGTLAGVYFGPVGRAAVQTAFAAEGIGAVGGGAFAYLYGRMNEKVPVFDHHYYSPEQSIAIPHES